MMIPLASASAVFLFVLFCEWLHSRRVKKVAPLAFGPTGKPRLWTKTVPLFRALVLGGMAWALVYLLMTPQELLVERAGPKQVPAEEIEHTLLLCDLSPSMMLMDAGETGELTRRDQMKKVVTSIADRFGKQVRYTLVCFYTRPVPMVKDASDKAILYNVLDDLPIEKAIGPGKTDLAAAINKSLELLTDLPEKSATMIVVTDGDTIELTELNAVPPSIKKALVLGVGNTQEGISIDGHLSRQDPTVLTYIASHLKGDYINVNEKLLGSGAISDLVPAGSATVERRWTVADYAMMFFIASACLYAFLPLLQEFFGSAWTAVRLKRGKAGA
jgi:Ca-activated chloride channel family protein